MAESKNLENQDSPMKRPTLSTSTSSFEALDPHDPNLSGLATTTFQKTSDYLYGELTSTQDRYSLLEEMNRVTITKYSDMIQLATTIEKTIAEQNDVYTATIEPYLREIDAIDENLSKLELAAYRLDNYTKQLMLKFKALRE